MNVADEEIKIQPQQGPQTMFLSSSADVVVYGGAAGGGKSFALLLEPLRHYNNPDFNAIIFRRTTKQIRNPGGLWDESMKLYPSLGGEPRPSRLDWNFENISVKFDGIEYESDVYNYQGSQIPFIGFDELTHFTEFQFFYMLSRNRSTSGVRGYIRATTNPDADSWVKEFIDWWIDDETGLAIPERSGVIRYFIRVNDKLIWADTPSELVEIYGDDAEPKSVTFIAAKLSDNQILINKDPGYQSNLKAQSLVERARLLDGNWKIRASAGNVFRQQWFPMVLSIPPNWVQVVRFWDRAGTEPNPSNKDPDWTRGVLVYRYRDGTFVVADVKSIRSTPGQVETFIKEVAEGDGRKVRIAAQQDPGSAGVHEKDAFVRLLAGYDVRIYPISKDKVTRAKPVSAQSEHGNIRVLKAPWNGEFFKELVSFPDGAHDDIVDALSGAYNEMINMLSSLDAHRARGG